MIDINESGFYTIKDEFFTEFNDPYLKGNKDENRPHYYCYKKDNLLWVIPLTSKVEKYRNLYNKDLEKYGRCDKFVFFRMKGDKESVLLIQDIFPITEDYIGKKYCINGIPYVLMSETLKAEIKTKANKILALIKKGIKFNPKQPDILKIYSKLLENMTEKEVAVTRAESSRS
ncbi:type III toxin-antitoxin system CptIN family toxin [Clostridium thermarum]|uniref:type III toxin-antitoxin system CptIN family toxin n=1 Tax=Clostridium thermarum TaxID=1716543 RepID=UPI00193ED3B0|nr:hypothetical protein [Clostridium thermarum]